ncbi:MAG: DUF87 domain-containing protein [Bacteroidota bacterium]
MSFSPKKIMPDFEVSLSNNGIEIGHILDIYEVTLKKLFNIWCFRIDKLIGLATNLTYRDELLKWRGFTYSEYLDLFNNNIPEQEFVRYPVFYQCERSSDRIKGGIKTLRQKERFILKYKLEPNEEGYKKAIQESGVMAKLAPLTNQGKPYKIPISKLEMHTYVVAPTGAGKSEILRNLFYQIQKHYPSFSLILIDPHGDLAKKLKTLYLNKDPKRLLYIDPYLDPSFSPTFNVFDIGEKSIKDINFASEQIIVSFEEVLTRQGGEITESMMNMLEKCLGFLLRRKHSTFKDLIELLKIGQIYDEARTYNTYFNEDFIKDNTIKKTRNALLTRIERIINQDVNRNFLAGKSTFNLEAAINSGKIIIFNIAELGELSQAMVGKFLLANIKSLIRKRNPSSRPTTFLFIDECQNLVSGSYKYMLSQLRKYGLHLVLANQYAAQLENQLEAVKQNTAVKVVGGDDFENLKSITQSSNIDFLGDFEFYSKIRGSSVTKFRSSDFLVKNESKELTKEEEKQVNQYMLENYYAPIKEDRKKPIYNTVHENTKPNYFPPFELYLGDAN